MEKPYDVAVKELDADVETFMNAFMTENAEEVKEEAEADAAAATDDKICRRISKCKCGANGGPLCTCKCLCKCRKCREKSKQSKKIHYLNSPRAGEYVGYYVPSEKEMCRLHERMCMLMNESYMRRICGK